MFLGIDLGTSGVKALLMDDNQKVISSASSPLNVSRPHSGWSEQSPADWIRATQSAIGTLKAEFPAEVSAVKGIGLSGQMHGATLVDQAGEVLRPCILWNDTRSHMQAQRLDNIPDFRAIGGNIVFPGFTAPKLVWVQENEPDIFAKVHKVLLPKDYLRLWLTGEYVSEMSDAAGTAWLDVEKRTWSDQLLQQSSMRREQMPSLVEGSEVSGYLRGDLARDWGMEINIPVAGGGGDNAASAIGMGAVREGDAFVSLGTSGVLFAANDTYRPKPESAVHTFCHAIPGTWHQMGVILSATDALNWYAGLVGENADQLTANLGTQLLAPSQVTFLPYLSGERTPHNDAAIRAAFLGISHHDDHSSMTRAVLEGVAFAVRDSLLALQEAGTSLSKVTAVGGGSRSDYWLQVIATVLGIPVEVPSDGDFGAAFGAARLGMLAATGMDPSSALGKPAIKHVIEPKSELAGEYQAAYSRYRACYPAISGI